LRGVNVVLNGMFAKEMPDKFHEDVIALEPFKIAKSQKYGRVIHQCLINEIEIPIELINKFNALVSENEKEIKG